VDVQEQCSCTALCQGHVPGEEGGEIQKKRWLVHAIACIGPLPGRERRKCAGVADDVGTEGGERGKVSSD